MSVNWSLNVKLALIAARYRAGTILLSTAAKQANITPLEFMEYLAGSGHEFAYLMKDFEEGQAMLDEFIDYKPPRAAGMKIGRAKPC